MQPLKWLLLNLLLVATELLACGLDLSISFFIFYLMRYFAFLLMWAELPDDVNKWMVGWINSQLGVAGEKSGFELRKQ